MRSPGHRSPFTRATARNAKRSRAPLLRWPPSSRRSIFASRAERRRCTRGAPVRRRSWNAGFAPIAARGFITCRAGQAIRTAMLNRERSTILPGSSPRSIFGHAALSHGFEFPMTRRDTKRSRIVCRGRAHGRKSAPARRATRVARVTMRERGDDEKKVALNSSVAARISKPRSWPLSPW